MVRIPYSIFLNGNFGEVPVESLGYTGSKNFALNQNYNNYQYFGNVSNSSNCGNKCGNSNITNAGAGTIVGGDYVVRNKNSNGKEGRLFSSTKNVVDLVSADREEDVIQFENKKPRYDKKDVLACSRVVEDLVEKHGISKTSALEIVTESNPNKTPCRSTIHRHLNPKLKEDVVDKRVANVEFDLAIQEKLWLWLTSLHEVCDNDTGPKVPMYVQRVIANISYTYEMVRTAARDVHKNDVR